jgi:hypothetical protein
MSNSPTLKIGAVYIFKMSAKSITAHFNGLRTELK